MHVALFVGVPMPLDGAELMEPMDVRVVDAGALDQLLERDVTHLRSSSDSVGWR